MRLSPADVAWLEGLDFVWNMKSWPWERFSRALRQYIALYGNPHVPRSFTVPSEAPWPEASWGFSLGFAMNNIRQREDYIKHNPERKQELEDLGFDWSPRETAWYDFRSALDVYIELNGNPHVPAMFKVPSEAPWPEDKWGFSLGATMNEIRQSEYYIKHHPERKQELEELGFRFKQHLVK
jgi:hypothetical protein